MKPRAYSYIRMSTDAQLKGDSLRRQLELSERYASEHGLELATDFDLKDLGVSAFTGDNVTSGALGRFLDCVKAGEIPVGSYLLVESLDRLSRETPRLALPRFLDIVNAGILLVTLADDRKYTTDDCRLEDLLYSLVVMSRAHEESVTKSHRLTAAWKHKRATIGNTKLTRRCPLWLELSADCSAFRLIPERASVIQRIYSEAVAGIGAYSIARRLNKEGVQAFLSPDGWHTSSINKILTNRSVLGEFQPHRLINGRRVPEGKPIPDYFPLIVDEGQFYAAQAGRAARKCTGGGRKGVTVSNLFSKLARCFACRGSMHFDNKGPGPKGGRYLVCANSLRGRKCGGGRWRYDDFESSFLRFVEELELDSIIRSNDDTDSQSWQLQKAELSLSAQLQQCENERSNAYALLQAATFDLPYVMDRLRDCEQRIAEIAENLKDVKARRSELAASERHPPDDTALRALISQLTDNDVPDLYRVRASISAKLRSIVADILIAPNGQRWVHDFGDAACVESLMTHAGLVGLEHLKEQRFFSVRFKNGGVRTVYPGKEVFEFNHQFLMSDGQSPLKVLSSDPVLSDMVKSFFKAS
jgi:DNA invertase Pin-like site-specific DNA recombinase